MPRDGMVRIAASLNSLYCQILPGITGILLWLLRLR